MELRSELSKKYLSEALILLLKNKSYENITIQEIVDKAGLSRMAYYRNFESKDDIIKYYLDSITFDFIRESNIVYNPDNISEYIELLYTHLLKYKKLGQLLLKNNLIYHVKNCFDLIFKNKSNDNDIYLYYFISGGLYNIYLHWLENDCAETPKELSRLFTDFFTSPVR